MGNEIVDLLRSYIINFPILKDWGMVEPICLTLAFSNSIDSMNFLKRLSGTPLIISEAEGVPGMKKAILRKTPQSIFLRMSRCETEKEQGKLSLLFTVLSGEKIGERRICCPTFVIFTGVVPDIIRRDTLVINISPDATDYGDLGDFFSLVPEPEQLGQVRQKLIDFGDIAEKGHSMISAACFLYPKLHERGEDFQYEEIVSLAKLMEDGRLETPPIQDIVMLVVERFLELAENGDFKSAIELPNLEDCSVAVLDSAAFHDGRHLYLSNTAFHEICKPLLELVSFRDIKMALREVGILQGSGGRYVSKMYYWRTFGVRSSATMLKFDMELIAKGDERLSYFF